MAELSNNKRIARNTAMLYIRMFVMLAVGLYTSRVVLDLLGAEDYGIYNIVGGIVVLFSFLNGALTSATQRFLNFNLGKKRYEVVHQVFCTSLNCFFILSLVFIILAETIGLWFLRTQINIPDNRIDAAFWVYQFSVVTFIINLLRVPYNASIIAYEKMDFYAYVSLLEVILKLAVVYLLYVSSYDKLIIYALLYTLVPFIINICYKVYCNRKFVTTHYRLLWDKNIFRELFSFSGWSLFGAAANMTAQQGLNILINIFYGVTANAAVGIANQISSNVYQFISNFQMAFQPQIVKMYAADETEAFYKLVFRTSKFSFYLMFILTFPILLIMQFILDVWLIEIPAYTAVFSRLILIFFLIESLTSPLWMSVQATGRIKRYQIWMALCIFLNFPLTYIVFEMGGAVYSAMIIRILVDILTLVCRLVYMKKYMSFPVNDYIKNVLKPILLTVLLIVPLMIFIHTVIPFNELIHSLLILSSTVLLSIVVIYSLGLDVSERQAVITITKKVFKIK